MMCVFQHYDKRKVSVRHFLNVPLYPSPANSDCPANLTVEFLQIIGIIL